ncbi:MAG: hypothetical protein JSV24_11475 [Bacteroidales bacterium]|nr:MAG: hypothetical protein JSV24_11475 [Bacteroidales bacterium]
MNRYFLLISGVLILSVLSSCEDSYFNTDPDVKLSFSVDTVFFDTVFTTVGSTTEQFTVINRNKQAVRISEIRLAGGMDSNFRLNINGLVQNLANDVEIRGKDSMYVFVEVTVDPVGQNSPMVIQDSIVFVTNGNVQDIDLIAWGQDVHLINGEIIQSATWTNDKPYLVYNSMMVDTLQILTIEAGTQIHFHNRSTMYISGTLIVNGTLDDPVIFEGDRLEELYEDIPGQWGGLYFVNGSIGNSINYAEIKNAINGLHLGNFYATSPPPDLILSNTKIEHMNYAGISSIGADISAFNCVISDCGFYALALTTGGSYQFTHSTIANFWNYANRITPSLVMTNYYNFNDTALFTGDLVKAEFGNCIIYGDRDTEIGIDKLEGIGEFSYLFDHCLIRADTAEFNLSDTLLFKNIIVNKDPRFASITDYDYQLDTLSFAKDKGSPGIGIQFPLDILMQDRTIDAGPDLGAYERIEEK